MQITGWTRRNRFSHWSIATTIATVTILSRLCTVCALRHCALAFASARSISNPSPFLSRARSATVMNAATSTYEIPTNLRGLFAGSGVEGLSNPLINAQILDLLPPEKTQDGFQDVRVLYLGTATYDISFFREKQTGRFVDKGCQVSHLDVASGDIDIEECAKAIASADILLVGGGNTLFAVDRWNHLGLVEHMRAAMERGCILTGGSAGAICWFDSGHSDSADPETYQHAMLQEYSQESNKEDESSDYDPANKKPWKYLRCPGLGFVPGPMVCCPHHDKTQSNGLLRAHDFDQMLLARAQSSQNSVLGIGIDHYAAFVVTGEDYQVYSLPEKPGSISTNEDNLDGYFDVSEDGTPNGKPGVWIKRVIVDTSDDTNGELNVEATVCPPSGKLKDLLAYGGDNLPGQHNVENDENQAAVDKCRSENPSGKEF